MADGSNSKLQPETSRLLTQNVSTQTGKPIALGLQADPVAKGRRRELGSDKLSAGRRRLLTGV